MQKGHQVDQRLQKGGNKITKRKLITKERAKEQRERITRCESSSPKPIKKKTTKKSKQLIPETFHIFKSVQITLIPNTPH